MRQTAVFGVDEQDDVEVDLTRWVRLAEEVVAAESLRPTAEVTLLFVDEDRMAALNAEHMAGTGPTDVLAFPIDDIFVPGRWPDNGDAGPDRRPLTDDDVPELLGDVVICPTVAVRQAPDHAGTVEDEIALLVVHGILHLLGMDHADPEETAQMQAKERDLLARFHRS